MYFVLINYDAFLHECLSFCSNSISCFVVFIFFLNIYILGVYHFNNTLMKLYIAPLISPNKPGFFLYVCIICYIFVFCGILSILHAIFFNLNFTMDSCFPSSIFLYDIYCAFIKARHVKMLKKSFSSPSSELKENQQLY